MVNSGWFLRMMMLRKRKDTVTVPLSDGSFMDVCPIYMDEGSLDCFHVPQNSNKITLELWPLHDGSINVLMWS